MLSLEVLIGMIGSGKSEYALGRARNGAIIVSHDALTEGFHGEYRYEQGLREFYRAVEERIVGEAFESGRSVVIDRTHLTRESRSRWLGFIGESEDRVRFWGCPVEIVAVTFPIEQHEVHARRRFQSDPRGRSYEDWAKVAWHHAGQASGEPFDGDAEGFDRVIAWSRTGSAEWVRSEAKSNS